MHLLKTTVPCMKKIKVLFQSRVDIYDRRGGDTVQLEETKAALEKLGVLVDITSKLRPDVSKYDLVHVFNLDWVCEPYIQIKNAKTQGKPVVLSPIHHSLAEFKRYEQEYRYGLAKVGNYLVPFQPLRDVFRNILKGLFYPQKLLPAILQLFMGIRRQQKLSIQLADYILVQTNKESQDLKMSYGVKDFKWAKVVNGVNADKFTTKNLNEAKKIVDYKKYIICVGRIEPRKNQISLIKALISLKANDPNFKDVGLLFAGSYNSHHPTYINQFKKLVEKHAFVKHLGFLDQKVLSGILTNSTVFACPSWFETTGLVYLEAVVSGVKSLVASGERAKEYLGENAFYCDPGNLQSISRSLQLAFKKPSVKKGFKGYVLKNYTWDTAAKQTLDIYKKVLNISDN